MDFKINDRVMVVKGRLKGRSGHVNCVIDRDRRATIYVWMDTSYHQYQSDSFYDIALMEKFISPGDLVIYNGLTRVRYRHGL